MSRLAGERGKKLIVLGWDGATFFLLDKMMEKGLMPNLKKILSLGVRSDLLSTIPPITGPSWASFRTGKRPENHGLFSFFRSPDEDLEPENIRMFTSSDIDGYSYWSHLNSVGKKCIVVDMPLSDPVEKIDGIMISGLSTRGKKRTSIYPPELKTILDTRFRKSFNRTITDGIDVSLKYLDSLIGSLDEKFNLDSYLLNTYEWDVFTTVYSAVDTLQHYFWKFVDNRSVQYKRNRKYFLKIKEFFKRLDFTLGGYLEILGSDGDIIIVSDHGFGPDNYTFYVNNFLKNYGYLSLKKSKVESLNVRNGIKNFLMKIDIFRLRQFVNKNLREKINKTLGNNPNIDWDRTGAFFRTNNEFGIYLNIKGKYLNGSLNKTEYNKTVKEIVFKLKEQKNEFTGGFLFENVIPGPEVYEGGKYTDAAPDIMIVPERGVNLRGFNLKLDNKNLKKNKDCISGFHEKEGIFVGFGPDFKKAFKNREDMYVYDIAPMILHIFDLPVDRRMDGRIVPGVLVSDKKSKIKKSYKLKKEFPDEKGFNDSDDIRQLKGLGYVD